MCFCRELLGSWVGLFQVSRSAVKGVWPLKRLQVALSQGL